MVEADDGVLGVSLGASDADVETPDSDPNSTGEATLGESGSAASNSVDFILITDQVNTGDLAFTLEDNVIARNPDGSRNRSLSVQEDDCFDKEIPGVYDLTYAAISAVTATDCTETFLITVNDPGDFPFDSLPGGAIDTDSLDSDSLPRWRQRISFEFLPFGWELIQRQDAETGVYFWTLTVTEYAPQPTAPLTGEELEGTEYRWAEAVAVEFIPEGWENILMQDEITGARYWTLVQSDAPVIAPFAMNDITVALSSTQQSYQTFKSEKNGSEPPYLPITVNVSVKVANPKNGQIVVDLASLQAYDNDSFFTYDKRDNFPSSTIFDSVTVTGTTATIKLKGTVAANSSESITLYYKMQQKHWGAVSPKAKMADVGATAQIDGATVYTVSPRLNITSSATAAMVNNNYRYNPTDNLIRDGQIVTVRNRPTYSYHYQVKLDPGYTHSATLYLPAGTTDVDRSGAGTYTVGTATLSSPIVDTVTGAVQVPAGSYVTYRMLLPTDTQAWYFYGYNADVNNCYYQDDIRFTLPTVTNGVVQNTYYVVDYKRLSETTPVRLVNALDYKTDNSAKWNFDVFLNVHNSGNENIPTCAISDGALNNPATSSRPMYATGFGYASPSSQSNRGTANITGVEWRLYQDTAASTPTSARLNIDVLRIEASRESTTTPWTVYNYYLTIASDRGGMERTEVAGTLTPTATGTSQTLSLTLPTLANGEYIKSAHLIPQGTAASPAPGALTPGNTVRFRYCYKAWDGQKWPDGTAVPNQSLVSMKWDIKYNDESGVSQLGQGRELLCEYSTGSPYATAIVTAVSDLGSVQPSSIIQVGIQGFNIRARSSGAWKRPMVLVRMPSGIQLNDTANIRLKDNGGTDKGKVDVVVVSESTTGYSYYKFIAPAGYDAPNDDNTYRFQFDFDLKVPPGIAAGNYSLATLLSGYDSTNFVNYHTLSTTVPSGSTAANFGLSTSDKFTNATTSVDAVIKVNPTAKMTSSSAVISGATGGSWSDASTVPAQYDETVQMRLELNNEGNKALTGFKLYDIIPYAGYLSSSASAKVTLSKVTAAGGTVYYYHGTAVSAPALDQILTINPATDANWNKTASGATAFFVDFGSKQLNGNEKLEVTLDFKIPGASNGEQTVYNQFSYTVNDGTVNSYTAAKQGFSTEIYALNYAADPSYASDVSNLPATEGGVFGVGTDSITVSTSSPTRTGYTFKNWNTKADGTGTPYAKGSTVSFTQANKTVILYAQWDVDSSYNIAIDFVLNNQPNGTGSVTAQQKNVGQKVTKPGASAVTYPGHTLEGWYTTSTFQSGSKWDFDTALTATPKTITLYANWQYDASQKFTVTFDPNGGSPAPANQSVSYDSLVTSPTAPINSGYKLKGWYESGSQWDFDVSKMPNKNITLKAEWIVDSAQTIQVSFDLNGGTGAIGSQTLIVNDTVSQPANPVKPGYSFVAWRKDSVSGSVWSFATPVDTTIFKDFTLYAEWTVDPVQTIQVDFDLNGGNQSGSATIAPQTLNAEDTVTIPSPDPVRAGYNFAGWNHKRTGAAWNFATQISHTDFNSFTLQAIWTTDSTQKTTVNFDTDGGTPAISSAQVAAEALVPAPSLAARPGYTLTHWVDVKDGSVWNFSSRTVGSADFPALNLKAVWSVDPVQTVTAHFDLNGGEGSIPAQTLKAEDTVTKPSDPQRFGYLFDQWVEASSGTPWNFGTQVTYQTFHDIYLKATWKVDASVLINVRFDAMGGSPTPSAQALPAESLVTLPTEPSRYGFLFVGWTEQAVSPHKWSEAKLWNFSTDRIPAVREGVTLYAQWRGDPSIDFEVTFMTEGSNTPGSIRLPAGSLIPAPADPTWKNHEFNGWFFNDTTGSRLWYFFEDTTPARDIVLNGKWRSYSGDGQGSQDTDPNGSGGNGSGSGSGNGTGNGSGSGGNTAGGAGLGSGSGSSGTNGSGSGTIAGDNAFWQAVNALLRDKGNTAESWKISFETFDTPEKVSNTGGTVRIVPGNDNLTMPGYILTTLKNQTGRELEISVGSYMFHFDADSYWRSGSSYAVAPTGSDEAAVAKFLSSAESFSLSVKPVDSAAINKLLGSKVRSQQLELSQTGDWFTQVQLSTKVTDEMLAGKRLFFYHYDAQANSLVYMGEMDKLAEGWYTGELLDKVGTSGAQYVVTDVLFSDAAVASNPNPETGGVRTVDDLITSGELIPGNALTADLGSGFNPLWLLAALPVLLAAVVFVVKNRKKPQQKDEM
ncbi:MAG: InlB B-repeat-containing protein [Oscillospiraceae bacterium]